MDTRQPTDIFLSVQKGTLPSLSPDAAVGAPSGVSGGEPSTTSTLPPSQSASASGLDIPASTTSNAPSLLLQDEPGPRTAEGAKTFLELLGEATRALPPSTNLSSGKREVKTLPPIASTAAEKLGFLQRLGNAFKGFLTSDPLKEFRDDLERINGLEARAAQLTTPEQFQARTAELKARLSAGESLESLRDEAYAVARQAAVQALGLRPFDCQVLGALAMDNGNIAEMKTGEGKTLTAVMALYLNALAGKGTHLVTVNDTLAARDAADMGPAFKLLGMSVGTVLENMTTEQKRAGYACDITYTTDRTLGFDFLHDSLAPSPSQRVQREPFFALIDEVDEVLLDEARTPLVISGQGAEPSPDYQLFTDIAKTLVLGEDILTDPKSGNAWLTDSGLMWVENQMVLRDLAAQLSSVTSAEGRKAIEQQTATCHDYADALRAEQKAVREHAQAAKARPDWWQRHVKHKEWSEQDQARLEALDQARQEAETARQQAASQAPSFSIFAVPESTEPVAGPDGTLIDPVELAARRTAERSRILNAVVKAHAVFSKGQDYLVADDEVQIVDEGKGRTSEGRRYNDGVHQALEAKEGVTVKNEQRTIASITYPNLFKRYARLAGMSGTAKSSEVELQKLYGLSVLEVPTNKRGIRDDRPDVVFRTLEEKYTALARDAAEDYKAGRPVLIGTLSVEHNLYVARKLLEAGVPQEALQVLNADTVRGDKTLENDIIANAGRSGIVTVATNMAGRGANIKPDLINFKALAGDILPALQSGESVVVTVDKPAEAQQLAAWLSAANPEVVSADHSRGPGAGQLQIRWSKDVEHPVAPADFTGRSFDGKDYPTGGLTVYGTERASSRRIDDQLIGRSGRQGAPGRSKFYLSLEDDLLRVFGKKAERVLELFGSSGEGVSHPLIDSLIAEAQDYVESEHFAAREATHKQDEVSNIQRDTYFGFRDRVMNSSGAELQREFADMAGDAVVDAVLGGLPDKSRLKVIEIEAAIKAAAQTLKVPIEAGFLKGVAGPRMERDDLEAELRDWADRAARKSALLPNADGVLRSSLLQILDNGWSEHLEAMETLKLGVGWQSLAEKDPEVEFKLGAYELFGETVARVKQQAVSDLLNSYLAYATVFSSNFQSDKVNTL